MRWVKARLWDSTVQGYTAQEVAGGHMRPLGRDQARRAAWGRAGQVVGREP